jgi:hypothetical protein
VFVYALTTPIGLFDGLSPLPRWIADGDDWQAAGALRAMKLQVRANTPVLGQCRPAAHETEPCHVWRQWRGPPAGRRCAQHSWRSPASPCLDT